MSEATIELTNQKHSRDEEEVTTEVTTKKPKEEPSSPAYVPCSPSYTPSSPTYEEPVFNLMNYPLLTELEEAKKKASEIDDDLARRECYSNIRKMLPARVNAEMGEDGTITIHGAKFLPPNYGALLFTKADQLKTIYPKVFPSCHFNWSLLNRLFTNSDCIIEGRRVDIHVTTDSPGYKLRDKYTQIHDRLNAIRLNTEFDGTDEECFNATQEKMIAYARAKVPKLKSIKSFVQWLNSGNYHEACTPESDFIALAALESIWQTLLGNTTPLTEVLDQSKILMNFHGPKFEFIELIKQ